MGIAKGRFSIQKDSKAGRLGQRRHAIAADRQA